MSTISGLLRRVRAVATRAPALVIVGLVFVAVTVPGGGVANAHTGFESSVPAEGAVVDEVVDTVTIVFTGEANPVGDRFVALNADGVLQEPVSIDTVDDMTFTLVFDPPLAGGAVGLRWSVQAADAHPIEGAFSFTVTAPAPTTIPATTIPATTIPAGTASPATEPGTLLDTTVADTAVSETTTPAAVVPASDPTSPAETEIASAVTDDQTTAPTLEEFLVVDAAQPGETTATIGRIIGFLGVALGLGALAFVATTLRGSRGEIEWFLNGVRLLGGVIVVGAFVEYIGVARIGPESFGSTWSTAPGFATVLRMIGGTLLAVGVVATIAVRTRALSAAVVTDRPASAAGTTEQVLARWMPDRRSWAAGVATVAIIGSFWFDGHTVSKGFRPLHAMVNSVHLAAGAVWVGGVVSMAVLLWSRSRSGRPMRALELVVQFSKLATISLAAVIAAGAVMAVLVLDSFGELTGTEWGQTLLLKTAAVALAVVAGAYNHFRLLPALEADPDSVELRSTLRSTLTAEAILLTFVVIVTAFLVAAAL